MMRFYLQDKDIMYSWLVDLHLEEYLPLFLNAGYDMRTVSKMTPEVSYYFNNYSYIDTFVYKNRICLL